MRRQSPASLVCQCTLRHFRYPKPSFHALEQPTNPVSRQALLPPIQGLLSDVRIPISAWQDFWRQRSKFKGDISGGFENIQPKLAAGRNAVVEVHMEFGINSSQYGSRIGCWKRWTKTGFPTTILNFPNQVTLCTQIRNKLVPIWKRWMNIWSNIYKTVLKGELTYGKDKEARKKKMIYFSSPNTLNKLKKWKKE